MTESTQQSYTFIAHNPDFFELSREDYNSFASEPKTAGDRSFDIAATLKFELDFGTGLPILDAEGVETEEYYTTGSQHTGSIWELLAAMQAAVNKDKFQLQNDDSLVVFGQIGTVIANALDVLPKSIAADRDSNLINSIFNDADDIGVDNQADYVDPGTIRSRLLSIKQMTNWFRDEADELVGFMRASYNPWDERAMQNHLAEIDADGRIISDETAKIDTKEGQIASLATQIAALEAAEAIEADIAPLRAEKTAREAERDALDLDVQPTLEHDGFNALTRTQYWLETAGPTYFMPEDDPLVTMLKDDNALSVAEHGSILKRRLKLKEVREKMVEKYKVKLQESKDQWKNPGLFTPEGQTLFAHKARFMFSPGDKITQLVGIQNASRERGGIEYVAAEFTVKAHPPA